VYIRCWSLIEGELGESSLLVSLRKQTDLGYAAVADPYTMFA
jgi:hypothetical protein